ncbi:MAG TPA: LamG domain-containing protein, partial [Bacteroidales bacterium]|nr:LamG domain-containing protein [Bacteroidales bacterium]
MQLNNGVLECRLKTTTGLHEYVSPANTVIPQVWQHIAWVFDVNTVKLYINGTLKGSAAASGIFQGENVPFAIGKSLLGGFNFVYGGRVDEISAWNKALSAADIQAMMADELSGTEDNLQLYYKFNQGVPGGDNTSITHLDCEIGGADRDAELMNFALNGETSNFNGTLNSSYQAISFPQIAHRLVSHPPFTIEATATSGLPVSFEVLSGPATINGNLVTLTGQAGEVTIKATQPGNSQFDPAVPVINSFMALDPATYVPAINVRNPLPGNVYMPVLHPIQLSAVATIGYPELFNVAGLRFETGNQIIYANDLYANSHFTAWWTPPSFGTHNIQVVSTNNFGATSTQSITVNVTPTVTDMTIVAAEGVWLSPSNFTQTVEAELPSYLGAFDQITATLTVSCPTGGCGEWDRVASVDAMGIEGRWFEVIRYITPYGVPCQHVIDLTDYMSILQGKVKFRFNCMTLDNGFVYKLTLNYNQGSPAHLYSTVYEIWKEIYPFGDYANLQPVEDVNFEFPDNA